MGHATTTRTSSKPSPDSTVVAPPMQPDDEQVIVRMYGQGLGDCFLLAFPRASGNGHHRPVYVLIDCGVIPQTPGGPDRMRQIVRDIRRTTRDPALTNDDADPIGHLDLLVLTHEHMDHLSGFLEAEDEWAKIHVDEMWMAWTEKEGDRSKLPESLQKLRSNQKKALLEVVNRANRFGLTDLESTIRQRLTFEGAIERSGLGFDFSQRTDKAFKQAKAIDAKKICCEPGEVRRVPNTDAMAYVLGPPRNQIYLGKPDPTPSDPETYEADDRKRGNKTDDGAPSAFELRARSGRGAGFALERMADGRSQFNSFAMPLLRSFGGEPDATLGPSTDDASRDEDLFYRSFPFGSDVRVPVAAAEAAAATNAEGYSGFDSYFSEENRWRRIDFDWLSSAETFAIQLGDLTNNSSLVLAFELPATSKGREQKVLLFVADAMVGNWLSWDKIENWLPQGDAQSSQAKPDIVELMSRVVLYKVGHHGSHNATLKASGLERMPSGDKLTAFVPVSPRVARDVKNWCDMPLDVLMNALAERTGGRVVLANGNFWPPVDDGELEAKRKAAKIAVSTQLLPAMIRPSTGEPIEPEYPLWVQMEVDF